MLEPANCQAMIARETSLRSAASIVACALLAAASQAAGAPLQIQQTPRSPSSAIPKGTLPTTAAGRAILRQRLAASAAGSKQHADIAWVLRLDRRFGGAGQPDGRRATVGRAIRVNAWWFARYPSPSQRVVLRDPDGVISTYREFHGFMVNPVATIGRWRGLNKNVSNPRLARTMLRMGVRRKVGGSEFRVWEYYDVADNRNAMRPGVSAMGQARASLLFGQAYRQTGDPAYARGSLAALRTLTVPVDDGGGVSLVSYPESQPLTPWYVERAYPDANPWKGAALNGFMVTLLDLERTSEVLGRPKLPPPRPEAAYDPPPIEVAQAKNLARRLVDEGLVSLKRYIPAHDTGQWTLYGLLTPGYAWRTKVADLNYHCYHIALLRRLDADFPGQTFAHFAVRWQGYVRKQNLECPGGAPLPTSNSASTG
jgi:hypothetical protein